MIRKDIELKYCVRVKHSKDMPLNKPRLNCAFRGSSEFNSKHLICEPDDCTFHSAHIKYCKANGIDLNDPKNFGINFKCVIK